MERMKFNYEFTNDKGYPERMLVDRRENSEGLMLNDICEMFLEFMRAAGFSEEGVINYFRK